MAFSVHVLTNNGVSLIANATAANRIIYTRIVTSSSAMTAEDAAASSPSSFSGPEGQIVAASAVDSLARIVGKVTNASASQIELRSFGLCGRLEGDSVDVVVCVLSDEAAAIILPPAGNVPVSASVPFPLNIEGGSAVMVEVTTVGSATLADLDRFVSLHKAGDSSTGDEQFIKGWKHFESELYAENDLYCAGELSVRSRAFFREGIEPWSEYASSVGSAENPFVDAFFRNISIPSTDGSLACKADTKEVSGGIKQTSFVFSDNSTDRASLSIGSTGSYSFAHLSANGTSEYCTLRLQSNIGQGASGGTFSLLTDGVHGVYTLYDSISQKYTVAVESDRIALSAGLANRLVIEDAGSGYSVACKAVLSVEEGCRGLAPSYALADTSITLPVGGITAIWLPNTGSGSLVPIYAGEVITISASTYKTAENSNGTLKSGERYIPAGKYAFLMDAIHSGGDAWALVQRVE